MSEKGSTNILTRTWAVTLLALICCALWGSAFPSIKTGYALFAIQADDPASQILFAGLRFFFAGFLAVCMGSIAGHKLLIPRGKGFLRVFCLCLFQTVLQYVFFYIGLAHTPGVTSSILVSSNVFFCILVATLVFRQEKLTPVKITGCVLGFAGVVLVNLRGAGSLNLHFTLTGEGFILISQLGYAFSSVLLRRFSQVDNPVMLSGWQFMCGGVIMAAAGYSTGGHFTVVSGAGLGVLGYLAFLSAAAYSIWAILLKYNDVSRVAVFGFMNPVIGVLLSAAILGESSLASDYRTWIALVLVCAGIWIVNSRFSKK